MKEKSFRLRAQTGSGKGSRLTTGISVTLVTAVTQSHGVRVGECGRVNPAADFSDSADVRASPSQIRLLFYPSRTVLETLFDSSLAQVQLTRLETQYSSRYFCWIRAARRCISCQLGRALRESPKTWRCSVSTTAEKYSCVHGCCTAGGTRPRSLAHAMCPLTRRTWTESSVGVCWGRYPASARVERRRHVSATDRRLERRQDGGKGQVKKCRAIDRAPFRAESRSSRLPSGDHPTRRIVPTWSRSVRKEVGMNRRILR